METYDIFYVHEGQEGIMCSHCLEESIDYLIDNGCVITDIRDMSTGKMYQVATNVRRIENE